VTKPTPVCWAITKPAVLSAGIRSRTVRPSTAPTNTSWQSVLEAHDVSARPCLEFHFAIKREARRSARGGGQVHGARAHESQWRGAVKCGVDGRQIARHELGSVRIDDVLGQQPLAFLVPMRLGPKQREDRHVG